MAVAPERCPGGGKRSPRLARGIEGPPAGHLLDVHIESTPNENARSRPDRRRAGLPRRRTGDARRLPALGDRVVKAAGVRQPRVRGPAPDEEARAGPLEHETGA